jgi:CelD/BcsL family acetyltransferase involved in cellulose biosynthesis
VEEVLDRHRFAEVRHEWADLLSRSGNTSPCLEADWLDAWWEAFAENRLRLLLARDDRGRLVGGAPLLWRRSWCSGIPLQIVTFAANVHSFRFDFVVAAEREPGPVLGALLRHAMASRPAADVFVLRNVPYDSGRLEQLREAASSTGLRLGNAPERRSPVIQLSGGWENYLDGLSKSFRSFLRRCEREWQEAGATLEVVGDGPPARATLEEGLALEAAGWKGRHGTAILQNPRETCFYRGLAARLDGSGRLRQYALRLGRQLVGWDLCVDHAQVCYALKTAYDETRAGMSPGFALQLLELKQLFAERRVTRYDLLPPDSSFKRRWTRDVVRQFGIRLYTQRPRARLARAIQNGLVPLAKRSRLVRLPAALKARIDSLRGRLGLHDA